MIISSDGDINNCVSRINPISTSLPGCYCRIIDASSVSQATAKSYDLVDISPIATGSQPLDKTIELHRRV
jgi:hypothetical protein